MIDAMRFLPLACLAVSSPAWCQTVQDVIAQGEKVFNQTCATGYCHALKGGSGGGAPRLAARGFDEAYINSTTTRGLPGTSMPAFGSVLARNDAIAVVAYVASLNGIATPNVGAGGRAGGPPRLTLPPEAERGRELFYDAVRSFGRCATCHEISGVGIAVASPIGKIPADVRALRALATPSVSTATVNGDAMPALVVSQAKARTVFYDLTSSPPVLRTVEPGEAKIAAGSGWRHAAFLGSYNDAELSSVLAFLRAAVKP
jgi:mono/diheme cytochrome c family protein